MKRSARTLPLGIDIGATHVRVALAALDARGEPHLIAVAGRPVGDDADVARPLAEALAELTNRERRCVLSVAEPDAFLREAVFPPMPAAERERAARYEIARFVEAPAAFDVRVAPLASGRVAVGAIRKTTLAARRDLMRRCGLHVAGIDYDAFALRRAYPGAHAVLDVGKSAARLYVYGSGVPRAHRVLTGGDAFTHALCDAYGLDRMRAEERKRIFGLGDAGSAVRERLARDVAGALVDARADGFADVRAIVLTGNGARLPELRSAIAAACAVETPDAAIAAGTGVPLPPGVVRAASADWALAWGCSLWSTAA